MEIINKKVCNFIQPIWCAGENISILTELFVKHIFFLWLKEIIFPSILIVIFA